MNKIFDFDPRIGSYLNKINKVVLTNTSTVIADNGKGRSVEFNGASAYVAVDNSAAEGSAYFSLDNSFTIEAWVKPMEKKTAYIFNNYQGAAGIYTGHHTNLHMDPGSGADEVTFRFNIDDGTTNLGTITGDYKIGIWYHVLAVRDKGSTIKLYVNAVEEDTINDTITTSIASDQVFAIGRATAAAVEYFHGNIGKVRVYDYALSAMERQKHYNAFQVSCGVSTSVTNFLNLVPHKAVEQEPSLVLFQNYENGNSLDLTNNDNNGTDTLIDYGVDGARFNGESSLITVADSNSLSFGDGSTDSPFSIEWYGKVNVTDGGVIVTKREDATNKYEYLLYLFEPLETQTRLLFRMYDQSATAYIGRFFATEGNDLYDGKEIHIIATYTGSGESSGVEIWLNGNKVDNTDSNDGTYIAMENLTSPLVIGANGTSPTAYSNSDYKNVKIYGKVLSDEEIAQKYNSIAKQVVFNDDMTNQNADGQVYSAGMILPNNWNVQSGSIKVSEDSTQKWFEQVTDGNTYIPSTAAYGIWEFDIIKPDTTSNLYINFTNTEPDGSGVGYRLMFNSEERILLARVSSGIPTNLCYTDTGYLSINTKYRIKITRSISGVFTMYIKGGTFGDAYTLVDVSGGSGTNPVTHNTYKTSNYIVTELDEHDKISNIKITRGV